MVKRVICAFCWLVFCFIDTACSTVVEEEKLETINVPIAGETLTSFTKTLPVVTITQTPENEPIDTADVPPTETNALSPTSLALQIPYQSAEGILILEQQLQSLGFTETGIIDGLYDEQTSLAVRHLQWLNKMPITGAVDQELYEKILLADVEGVRSQPPFPARSLSQYTAGYMMDGFLKGRLEALGYLDGKDPDFNPFIFDAKTEVAVKAFQKNNSLQVNGIVNFEVWKKLFSPTVIQADGTLLIDPADSAEWSTDFYPILEGAIDLAFDGVYIWVLHSQGEDAFDNLLFRIDPSLDLLHQSPPIMLGDLDLPDNRIAEMMFAGNRLWFLLPQPFEPPQIINLIPESAEKFIHTAFTECDQEACFPAEALGYDGKKIWATSSNRAWAIDRNSGKGYLSHLVSWSTHGEMAFDGKCMWMGGEYGLTAFHTGGDYPCPGAEMGYSLPSGPVVFDGRRIWVADYYWNAIYWLDTQTGTIGDAVMVGNNPTALAFDGQILWVANGGDDTVQGIDVATGSVGPTIPTGNQPVALVHDGERIWVANAGDRTLQKIDVQNYQIEIVSPTQTLTPSFTPTQGPPAVKTAPVLVKNLYLTSPRMSGDDVLTLQNQLLALGYAEVGEADGIFGPNTDEAVRHFQFLNQLVEDGVVGPLTWEKLFSTTAIGP